MRLASVSLITVIAAAMGSYSNHPLAQGADAAARQWQQFQADAPKTILELQPFRSETRADIESANGVQGTATLTNLNPDINAWFLLTLDWDRRLPRLDYHLENPQRRQRLTLLSGDNHSVRIEGLSGGEPCVLWEQDGRGELLEAAASGLPYAPLCSGRLYLRNPTTGHRTSLEQVTEFLRNHVFGGEEIISFVKKEIYANAFLEKGVPGSVCTLPQPSSSPAPRPAMVSAEMSKPCIVPESLGLDLDSASAGLIPGQWYAARDLPGVYASVLSPQDITSEILLGRERSVNRLDAIESKALVYLVAFDLEGLELHFVLGTEHPGLDWSPRPPERERDPRLPGPDGVATAAPLVTNGMVSPWDADHTIVTFAGGFKREHGAFRYGPLALVNHGSHYGFVQEGTIFSKLQPELATLLAMDDGRVEMKTWTPADDAMLAHIRYARQNGVPLIEYDAARGRSVPGAFVNLWGPGNWSGSAEEVLRTLRGAACLLEDDASHRFLVYGYFSDATPSAMTRVFEAYHCRYAMQLDINALEHTYLALYLHRNHQRVVEHLVPGMEQVDSSTRAGFAPRFLAVPDDRDFFYLVRRQSR
jgi:hypothetical protein